MVMNSSSDDCKIDAYPMLTLQGCMIMRITQISLSAEEPPGFIITFQSVLYFSNLSCYKQRQLNLLIYDGNQYHSSFCMLPRAVSHHWHGSFNGWSHQSSNWKYDHECLHTWRQFGSTSVGPNIKHSLHSLLHEASTTWSRQFGFAKRSSRTVFNRTRSTLSNN